MGQENVQVSQKSLWTLWMTMTCAVFIYGGIGYFVRKLGSAAPSPELLPMVAPVFFGMATLETLALYLFFPRFARKSTYSSYSILRWAFAESIGVNGLVLFILGASPLIFVVFLAWSLLLNLSMMPSDEDRDRFESLRT